MKSNKKISQIIVAALLIAFLGGGLSSCKTQKVGCPNQITQADQSDVKRV